MIFVARFPNVMAQFRDVVHDVTSTRVPLMAGTVIVRRLQKQGLLMLILVKGVGSVTKFVVAICFDMPT